MMGNHFSDSKQIIKGIRSMDIYCSLNHHIFLICFQQHKGRYVILLFGEEVGRLAFRGLPTLRVETTSPMCQPTSAGSGFSTALIARPAF